MLRSWTEELQVVIRERHLELGVLRFGKVLRSTQLDRDGSSADLERAMAEIGRLSAPPRWRLRIGGWQAVHGVLPWSATTESDTAQQAAALALLQRRHGLDPAAHLVCVVPQGYGRPSPYWAVARELVDTWQQSALAHRARLVAIESLLLAQVSAVRAELQPSTLLFVREDALVHVCELHEGRWQGILTRAVAPGSTLASSGIVAEERRLRLQETLPVQTYEQLPPEQRPAALNPVGLKRRRGTPVALSGTGGYLGLQS